MAIKFGINQMGNPTPHNLSVWFDVAAGFLGIVNGWLLTAAYVSHNVSDILGSIISGLLIPSLLFFKRFFGSEVTQKRVDIEDVAEIKTTDK